MLKKKVKEYLGIDLLEANQSSMWNNMAYRDLETKFKHLQERINLVYHDLQDYINDYHRLNDLVEWLHEWVNIHPGHSHTKKKKSKKRK